MANRTERRKRPATTVCLPKTIRLKPLPLSKWPIPRRLNFILPIFFADLFSGFTVQITPLLSGLLISALLLGLDSWAWSESLTVWFVNRMRFTNPQLIRLINTADVFEAERCAYRKKFRIALQNIVFTIFSAVILSVGGKLAMWIVMRSREHDRQEVRSKVEMSPAHIVDGTYSASLTLKNNSDHDIVSTSLTCKIDAIQTAEGGGIFGPTFITPIKNVLLKNNGDGQSFSCMPERMLIVSQPNDVVCADITWTVAYSLADQPLFPLKQESRYAIYPGHTGFEQLALNAPLYIVPKGKQSNEARTP